MNDEIKEILYVLKHIVIGRASRLTPREADKLLDYITNLQQENKNQAKRNSRQRLANKKQQELILKLQQEIEKLNEDKRGMLVQLYKENVTKDIIQEEYEKIIFEYLAENCSEFDDEHMQHLADLKVEQYIKLQQENEKSNNENKQYKEYVKELKDSLRSYHIKNNKLINENERLKETNVYCNRTDCVGRIKDSRKYDSVYQEKEDYKSRIDKAVEYIKEHYPTSTINYQADKYNLLNILQKGSDSQ